MTDLDAWARSLGWASYVERQDAIAANEARYARGLAWQQEHAAELRLAQGHRRPAAPQPNEEIMNTIKLSLAPALLLAAMLASPANALPLVCSGTVTSVGLSGNATIANMSGGNCVSAGDKLFGDASVGGAILGTGSVNFSALTLTGDVTLGFIGTVGPNAFGDINYSVAINPTLAGAFLIHDLEKDFTLNSNPAGTSATATLTGTASFLSGPAVLFSCVRTVNPNTSSCPVTETFGLISQMNITQHIVTGANAVVTGITDTISQAVPEPASLAILGLGLLGIGLARRRRTGAADA